MQERMLALFYQMQLDAMAAGRGAPERPAADQERVRRAMEYMDAHLEKPLSLADIAAQSSLHPNSFHRIFSSLAGKTPRQYLLDGRMRRARIDVYKRQVLPPSTVSSAPVVLRDSRLPRYQAALAMSSNSAISPKGV